MAHTKAHYSEVDPVGGAMYFLRDALDCENLGITVVDADPNWEGKAHDHVESDHEEVYLLVKGEGTITVDGDTLELREGDAVRVSPDASRQIRAGDVESTFVIVGAP